MIGTGTEADPITEASVKEIDAKRLAYKYCRCADCKKVGMCTPRSDYWRSAQDGQLRCDGCFDAHLLARPEVRGIIDGRVYEEEN